MIIGFQDSKNPGSDDGDPYARAYFFMGSRKTIGIATNMRTALTRKASDSPMKSLSAPKAITTIERMKELNAMKTPLASDLFSG